MTDLRLISKTTSSPGIDVELSRTIASIRAAMREGGHQTALPVATRSKLEQRLHVLSASGANAKIDQIEFEIAKLMTAYPSSRAAALTDVQVTVRQYAIALDGVPLWALRAVLSDIARGSVAGLNPDFMPTAPRVRQIVDERTARSATEARQIREVLEAPVVLPDDENMAAAVRKNVADSMRERADELRRLDRDEHLPKTDEDRAAKRAPSIGQLRDIYATRNLPGVINRNVTRDVTRNVTSVDTVTVGPEQAAGGTR